MEHNKTVMPFQTPCSIIINGQTMVGKSTLCSKILKQKDQIFTDPVPNFILFSYKIHQELYNQLKLHFKNKIEFIKGLPTIEQIDELCEIHGPIFIVVDDQGNALFNSKDVEELVSISVHHKNITSIIISPSLFYDGKKTKAITIHAQYLILMNNIREQFQIALLGKRLYPQNKKFLLEAFQDSVKKDPYSYLLVDYRVTCPQELRLRTNIFPGETTIVYTEVEK